MKEEMKEWIKWLSVAVIIGVVLGLLVREARAEGIGGEKSRTVVEQCREVGQMGKYATELVYMYQRKEVLHRLKSKFPESAKYAEYIVNAVLEPPIMGAVEFQKGLEEACLKENTRQI